MLRSSLPLSLSRLLCPQYELRGTKKNWVFVLTDERTDGGRVGLVPIVVCPDERGKKAIRSQTFSPQSKTHLGLTWISLAWPGWL